MERKTNKILDFIKGDLWIIPLDIIAVNASYLLVLLLRLSFQEDFHKSVLLKTGSRVEFLQILLKAR